MDILSHRLKPTQNKHSARIAIVCDYASAAECHDGVPLSGLEAGQFNRLISAIRLPRHEIYLTWALKSQQTKQSMASVYSTKGFKHTDFYILQQELIDELAEISTDVIILMGEFASLLLLDNLKYVETKKHRGSAFKASDFPHLHKLSGKVICITNHPRDLMYGGDPKVFYVIMNDLQKFQTLIGNHSLLDHQMIIHTAPTFEEVIHFYNRVSGCDETAFDIEATPKHMTCFSLTCGKNEAMSIPLMDNKGNYWTPEQEIVILDGLANILGDLLIKKIAQNGMFDFMYVLRTLNIVTRNFWFDTMLAQHLCWTDLPKGLDFLTSIYTYFPYHKDEGKSTHLKYIKDWPGYWTYNAKDSITTHNLVEPLQKEIDDLKCQDAFDYMMELHKPLMEMEYRGFYADRPNIIKTKHKLEKHICILQKALNKLAGKELNTNSSKQMVGYFYGDLMIKPYVNRTTGNATADAVALSRIAKKKTKGSGEARIILKMRTLGKLSSTYFNTPLDDDSRLRCAHKIAGTDSGRLSTERTFFDTGANLQNQPPIFRKYLLADKGKYILEFDKARAEAHVVAFLCQDANMIEAFESGIDVHTFNASNIFEVPMDQVSKQQRSMGKKVVHACVDKETEVLTPNGWVAVEHVKSDEPIAVWRADNKQIYFECPGLWYKYKYTGDLYKYNTPSIDQHITPNHRMPYMTNGKIKEKTAEELAKFKSFKLPVTGDYSGTYMLSVDRVCLLAAVQADGSYAGNNVRFHLKKQRKIVRIKNILAKCGIPFKTFEYEDSTVNIVFPKDPEVERFLTDKKFSWSILKLNSICLDVLLDEILFWDGHIANSNNGRTRKEYCSAISKNCEIISTIAHLRNKQGLLREVKRAKIVSLNRRQFVECPMAQKIPYDDYVYCPTVSTGYFMIRRNNSISVTGNSNYKMGPKTFSDNLAKDGTFISEKECKILLNAYAKRFPGLARWHREIEETVTKTRMLYNLFGRPKRYLGMIDGNLVRSACSYIPQSTVAEGLNRGMISIYNDLWFLENQIEFLVTVHDSVGFQVNIKDKDNLDLLFEICERVDKHMYHKFTYKGRSFAIGLDAKISNTSWGKMHELKDFTPETLSAGLNKLNIPL